MSARLGKRGNSCKSVRALPNLFRVDFGSFEEYQIGVPRLGIDAEPHQAVNYRSPFPQQSGKTVCGEQILPSLSNCFEPRRLIDRQINAWAITVGTQKEKPIRLRRLCVRRTCSSQMAKSNGYAC